MWFFYEEIYKTILYLMIYTDVYIYLNYTYTWVDINVSIDKITMTHKLLYIQHQ